MEKETHFFKEQENQREQKKEDFFKKMQASEQEMCQRVSAKTEKPAEELEKRIKMLQVAEHFLERGKL